MFDQSQLEQCCRNKTMVYYNQRLDSMTLNNLCCAYSDLYIKQMIGINIFSNQPSQQPLNFRVITNLVFLTKWLHLYLTFLLKRHHNFIMIIKKIKILLNIYDIVSIGEAVQGIDRTTGLASHCSGLNPNPQLSDLGGVTYLLTLWIVWFPCL